MLGGGADGARVEVCATRNCTAVAFQADVTGSAFKVPEALATGVWFWRLRWHRNHTLDTVPGPTWQFTVGARSAPIDASYGTTLDVNGDGCADVAVGAIDADRVYLYAGGTMGVARDPWRVLSAPEAGLFGWTVGSAGDVNGDGYADLLVTAPTTGRAYVYAGGPLGVEAEPTVTLDAPAGVGSFGVDAVGAGDLNRDGYADVVVGSGADRAYVYLGSAAGLATTPAGELHGPAASEFSGTLAALGDVNGDGYADLSASGHLAGEAYIFLGTPNGLPEAPSAVLRDASEGFGYAVAAAGDVNGDGLMDLAVGDEAGRRMDVYRGTSAGITGAPWVALDAGDRTVPALPLAAVGDVDGDGYADLAAGGWWNGVDSVLVFRGGPTGMSRTPAWVLDSASSTSLHGLNGIGDVNGDGIADVALGSNTHDVVSVHLGAVTGPHTEPDVILSGPTSTWYGWSVR